MTEPGPLNIERSPVPALTEDALLCAYDIQSDGATTSVPLEGLTVTAAPGANYRWIHLDMSAGDLMPWLTAQTDPIVAEALTEPDTQPRCSAHEKGILIYLRGINLNPDAEPEDMVSVRLWVTSKLVISVRLRRLLAVVGVRDRFAKGNAPLTPGGFVVALTDDLTDRMMPTVRAMTARTDDAETKILDDVQTGVSAQIADLRRDAIIMRRYISPQKEALTTFAGHDRFRDGPPVLSDETRAELREAIGQTTRIVDELEAIRERCVIINDHLKDERAEDMNNRIMVLSVVTAIFLPLGLITGLLGVNIAGIPGTDTRWAFAALCAILISFGIGMAWWFHSRKWL